MLLVVGLVAMALRYDVELESSCRRLLGYRARAEPLLGLGVVNRPRARRAHAKLVPVAANRAVRRIILVAQRLLLVVVYG